MSYRHLEFIRNEPVNKIEIAVDVDIFQEVISALEDDGWYCANVTPSGGEDCLGKF